MNKDIKGISLMLLKEFTVNKGVKSKVFKVNTYINCVIAVLSFGMSKRYI